MDSGMILGFSFGYLAAMAGAFLLYSPVIAMALVLLVVAGILKAVLLPFALLIRKLRSPRPEADLDGTWLLGARERARE
ncbi:MAG: hypothetical protein HOQ04_00860 [Pseudarthrobacter sp.]|nr:hypothetical protein [Pseudarthrobacter sp.]